MHNREAHWVLTPSNPRIVQRRKPSCCFDLSKAPFNNFPPETQLGLGLRRFEPLAHGLHDRRMRLEINLPAFGIVRALIPHRAVAVVAAIAFHPHTALGAVAFVIQYPVLGTGDALVLRVVVKVLCGVRVVMRRFAFPWLRQHVHLFLGSGLQVGSAPIAIIGHGQRIRRSRAEVLTRLFHHGRELTHVTFLTGRLAGKDYALFSVSDGLSVVGVPVGVADFHAAGFRFDPMVVFASIGLQLGQALLDFLAQHLALSQSCGQTIARLIRVGILSDNFQFDVVQSGIQLGQEFFHMLLAPALGSAARGLDFRAIQGLEGQSHTTCLQGQLHTLFENLAQGFLMVAPKTPQTVVVGLNQARQPQQREVLAAGCFQFAGRANPMEISVEPDFQKQTKGVGRTAFNGCRNHETQGGQIQLLHKLPQEAGRMIDGHPVFQRRWKQKLLPVIRTDGLCHAFVDVPTHKKVQVLRQSRKFVANFPLPPIFVAVNVSSRLPGVAKRQRKLARDDGTPRPRSADFQARK